MSLIRPSVVHLIVVVVSTHRYGSTSKLEWWHIVLVGCVKGRNCLFNVVHASSQWIVFQRALVAIQNLVNKFLVSAEPNPWAFFAMFHHKFVSQMSFNKTTRDHAHDTALRPVGTKSRLIQRILVVRILDRIIPFAIVVSPL